MSGSLLRSLSAALPSLRWGLPLGAASAALPALSTRWLKTTTGIVGLPVDEQARQHLQEKLSAVLDAIKIIPETAEYRRSVELTIGERLKAVASGELCAGRAR
jgi:hypothetical protein